MVLSKSISSTAAPNKDLTDAEAKKMLNQVSSSKNIILPRVAPANSELPPLEDWGKIFKFSEKRKRKTLCNAETAKKLAEILVPEGSKDKIIVEGYAG